MHLNDLPHYSAAPKHDQPLLTAKQIQSLVADAGLFIEHTFSLGLVATWSIVPEAMAESLYEEPASIAEALQLPNLATLHDSQVVSVLQDEEKYGWLIRAETLFHTDFGGHVRAKPESFRWFYNDRLDMALLDAIAWKNSLATA
ncbi:hypothetical protein IGB42_02611 [Andreprevotia sp. IGB-42]|uniref:hypothetical protein n=1 Tax=Andreprevotia sp. IGB-42 TaxID=2497473 RepID=UPI001358B3BE|nr:hypothetical protein [Andreprevotia sp. IGB-42]KAF0812768.1 hypothetical protein IGB42_02611 [Andreprevotia sp. IGB-42]